MAVARRADALGASPIPTTGESAPGESAPAPGTTTGGLLGRADVPPPDDVAPDGHLRRCTFRRLEPRRAPGRGNRVSYDVTCLLGGPGATLSLGELATARVVCAACRAAGIFRPDES